MSSHTHYPRPQPPQPAQPFPQTPSPFINAPNHNHNHGSQHSYQSHHHHQTSQTHTTSQTNTSSSSSSSHRQKNSRSNTQTGYEYWSQKLGEQQQQRDEEEILESGVENPFADPLVFVTKEKEGRESIFGVERAGRERKGGREQETESEREAEREMQRGCEIWGGRSGDRPLIPSSSSSLSSASMSRMNGSERNGEMSQREKERRLAYEYKPRSPSRTPSQNRGNFRPTAGATSTRTVSDHLTPHTKNEVKVKTKRVRFSSPPPPRQALHQHTDDFSKREKKGKDSLRAYSLKALSLGLFGGKEKNGKGKSGKEEERGRDSKEPKTPRGSPRYYNHDDSDEEGEAEREDERLLGKAGKEAGMTTWTEILSSKLSTKEKTKVETTTKTKIRGLSGSKLSLNAREERETAKLLEKDEKRMEEQKRQREKRDLQRWYRYEIERLVDERRDVEDKEERKRIRGEIEGLRKLLAKLG